MEPVPTQPDLAPTNLRPSRRGIRLAVIIILLIAAFVRLVALDRIPPGLWYDEAIYALDGLEAATTGPRIFYTTENHMREPLYIWSLGGFFALFGHSVLKARLVSALWGIVAVAVFWPVARRAFGNAAAGVENTVEVPTENSRGLSLHSAIWPLVALFAFSVFRWHVHFSRTVFRALLPSLFILLVVWLFCRWRERRHVTDAALAGAALGLGMYTYLSFRLVPLLMGLWVGWLLWKGQIHLRRDWRQLGVMAGTALLFFLPLGVDWVLHPDHFSGRTDEVSMFTKTVTTVSPDGAEKAETVAKPVGEALRDLGGNALQVAGMWTFRGDHVGKHNLPHEPVFDWANGLVFYAGLLWCLLHFGRNEWAFLTLAWLAVLSLTSIFSFGAPNILRMQGAAPAAILVYAFGLRWFVTGAGRLGASRAVQGALAVALLATFAAVQLWTYFVKFPVHPAVRQEFQVEMFTDPAEGVRRRAEELGKSGGVVLVPEEMSNHPSFRFITAGLENVRPYGPAGDLATTASGAKTILVTQRSESLAEQAGRSVQEQIRAYPGARLLQSFPVTVTDRTGRPVRRLPWAELWNLPPSEPAFSDDPGR